MREALRWAQFKEIISLMIRMVFIRFILASLLLLGWNNGLRAQSDWGVDSTDYDVEIPLSLVTSNPNNQYLFDGTIIVNDKDTIGLHVSKNYYNFGYNGAYNDNQKFSFKIILPDFPEISLDSVNIHDGLFYLYILKKNEPYYVINGIKKPLVNGYKYISIEISKQHDSLIQESTRLIGEICETHKLEIAVSYKDSIDKYGNESEWRYGCLQNEIINTYWLQRRDGRDWLIDDSDSIISKIRGEKHVDWIGIPQYFFENIINGIIIEFKDDVDSTEIESIIEKYELKKHNNHNAYLKYDKYYYFNVSTIIPSNGMMIRLMKEQAVKKVRPLKVAYITCG